MKKGWVGKESAGKSLLMAVHALKVQNRNIKWVKRRQKLGLESIPRTMAFDTPMSEWFIKRGEKYGIKYLFYRDLNDIMPLTQIDIFINEINKFFPQRGAEPLTSHQAEFLSQAAKQGVDIYFCGQDFSQTHKQFRFLVNEMTHVVKICGSIRPIASAPPVNWIWGVVLHWSLNPDSFKGDNFTMDSLSPIPSFYWINKTDTQLYDTLHKVRGTKPPPLKMVEQDIEYLDEDGLVTKKSKKWVKK